MDCHWNDKGNYWVTKTEQLSDFWHRARMCRITGSKIGGLVGHSRFTDSVKAARQMTGIFRATYNYSAKDLMQNGIIAEPHVRKWYSMKIEKEIHEMGLAVPKWDTRFGSSVDGIIDSNNICEIKVPGKMYAPLKEHRNKLSEGVKFGRYYHSHIWENHYDQMQLGMAVTGAKKCHYVVYLPSENNLDIPSDVYCEIVEFNIDYWNELYEDAIKAYDNYVIPLMKEYNITRIDPC